VFVFEALIQTLTNKTLGTGTVFSVIPVINDGITFTFNPNATVAGINVGSFAGEPSVPVNGDLIYDNVAGEIKGRANGEWRKLGNEEVFTWTNDHNAAGFDLLNVGGITINNPADTFQYIITPAAIIANRIVNLPLLAINDTFVFEFHTQILTNKTLGIGTVFSVIPVINDGIKFTFNPNDTVSGLNVGQNTVEPSLPINGDIFYDNTVSHSKQE